MEKLFVKPDLNTPDDLLIEELFVPEWKGWVRVRGLTGLERDSFEASCVEVRGEGKHQTRKTVFTNIRAKLVVRCLVDEKGARLYADKDADALGKKSAAALDRIFSVAQRLSGIGEEEVKELAGNSEADLSGVSPLNSHEN